MIAVLDYGSGNLHSARRALAESGADVVVTSDPRVCREAAGLVVPGVGAFAACMKQLRAVGGDEIIVERHQRGNPILGICVGMQILFTSGDEKEESSGLGIFDGEISQLDAPVLPHIGWNTVNAPSDSILFQHVQESRFYFVHSYAARTAVPGAKIARSHYGTDFVCAVESGHVMATQFHPEKSGMAGLRLLQNWIESL